MKNITVSIDDETYRLARIRAAEEGTSVSALVRDYLIESCQGENKDLLHDRMNEKRRRFIEDLLARGGGLRSEDNLSREQLYERDALR